ncbi:MAG TPA: glycosyl hydrolase family 18 protein, partial [Candidatus Dormibacteraeota bacterium]|nr:glycosyl hydrolase family 18 protein [Candidatus Dormibacteraeota bacterium]
MTRAGSRRLLTFAAAVALTAAALATVPVAPPTRIAKAATMRDVDTLTAPRVMTEAAQLAHAPATSTQSIAQSAHVALTARNPNLQREVFGFVNASNLGDSSVGYTSWDLGLLSTVAYFGLAVDPSGGLVITDTGWSVLHSATMTSFVNAAHAHGVRVLVSLNIHDFSTDPNNFVCQALIPSHQATTISEAINEINKLGLDGINVDYEGTITTCANGATNRAEMVQFVSSLRANMPSGYLAIDTFSGSAEDNQEFFDVTGIAPSVDAFFVMAYDMDYANSTEAPLNCSSFCFNPISPLNTYRFNATKSMQQYTALVPSTKVILGQPYYGRRGCVAQGNIPHQAPIVGANFVSPTYIYASTIPSQSGVISFTANRDPLDGVSEWDTWYDTDWGCIREQYWDDKYSLAAKYNLVGQYNLGGVGMFTLDYGGSSPELWSLLSTYFSCPATATAPTTASTTEFTLSLSAGSCAVSRFDLQQMDTTVPSTWSTLKTVPASASTATAVADGFPNHQYTFRVRAHSTAGVVSAWFNVTVQVSATATKSRAWSGLYTLDGFGGAQLNDSPPLSDSAYWPGWSIARAAKALPGATAPQSGLVLDGYGGLHSYGAPAVSESGTQASHRWGFDIARDFAFLPDGTGGFVLDGYGGLHGFRVNGSTAPLVAVGGPYWGGWDIARKVVIWPDGTGGYVLDGYGGVHAFGINAAAPAWGAEGKLAVTSYWNWNIARDIVLVAGNGGHSGYVLDGYGG